MLHRRNMAFRVESRPRCHAPTRLHLRGLRGAEEEFLLGAAIANLVLLARTNAKPARTRRPPPVPERIDHMARISRGRFEQSYYATIF